MNNRLLPIELCKYTLRQSLCDEGKYPEFYTAQELIDEGKYPEFYTAQELIEEVDNGKN